MQTEKQPGQAGSWASSQPTLTLPGGRAVNPWLVLTSLMFGFFMSLLDATIVNIAFSDIQTNLQAELTTATWVLNSYNIVFAVLLVTMGRFADQFGRKRMFMLGMILFSIGSLLCAIAPSIEWLIGFRALQAIGAAALNPVSLAIISVVFPPQKRGAAIGIWGAMAGLAAAVGPVLGGFLVQTFGWRSIFFVNLPFCIIGLFMVFTFVPENKDQNTSRNLDYPGTFLLTSGMFCLVLAITQGNEWGWSSIGVILLFVASLVSFIGFYFTETRVVSPLIDFRLFNIRSFSVTNVAMFMFSVGIQGSFLILTQYLIRAQNLSPLDAAYALIPLALASFIVSGAFSRFSAKADLRLMGMLGIGLVGVGTLSLCTLGVNSGYLDTAWRSIIIGMGMGLCFLTFSNIVLSEVPRAKVGVASGVFNTFRQIGFALGVALLLSIFTGQIKDNTTQATSRAIALVQQEQSLPIQLRTTISEGLAKAASQSGGTRNSSPQVFDISKLADNPAIPNGQALKPQLVALNSKITNEFKQGAVDSFSFTWVIAGIIALLGIIPAYFARYNRQKDGVEHFVAEVG